MSFQTGDDLEKASFHQHNELFLLFDLSSDFISIVGLDGKRKYINIAYQHILGLPVSELLNTSVFDIVHEDDKIATKIMFASVKDLGQIFAFENRVIRKDGSIVHVSWNLSLDEQTNDILIIGRDITQQKKAADIIRNSEKHYKSLIENIQIGILRQEKDSQITICNFSAREMLGLSEDQLLGKTSIDPDWNVIHSDGSDFPGHTHPVPTAIATLKPVKDVVMGVYRPVTKDRVWLLVNAEPQFDLYGEFDHVICTFTDITKQRKSLVQKQEELLDILDNTVSFFATIDLNSQFTFINKAMKKALGITDEMITSGYKVTDIPILDARFSHEERIKKLLVEGSWSGTNTFRGADGRNIIAWQVLLLHRNENQLPTHISVTAIDITDTKALEEERMLSKLQSEFVSIVSHEFRTPLTIFRTSIELLQLYLQDLNIVLPEKLVNRLEIMDHEIDRLINVISDLITVGKVNAGGLKVNKKNISIVDLVRQSIERQHMMKTDDRVIQLTVAGNEKPVMADEFLITHVIDNLISNSIKYSMNAPAPEIEIRFEESGCIISVKDYGIGIDEEDQQKMFNSFFRSPSVKDIPGTGLGLVIAKKMLDLHKGEICVKSAKNAGTEIITKLIYE